MKLFASIYIGSYEVTLKVFMISQEKGLKEIDCLQTGIDILHDIYEVGQVRLETTDKLCHVLKDMKDTMESYHVDDYRIYAGYTLHEAENELFVLDQIRQRIKRPVTLLTNSEHRFLGYAAVASMDSFEKMIQKSAVIIDVGGASLQITLFVNGGVVTTQHLLLGTFVLRESIKKLLTMTDYRKQIRALIDKEIDVFSQMYLKDITPEYMIILGDRVSTLSDATQKLQEDCIVKSSDLLKKLQVLEEMSSHTVTNYTQDNADSNGFKEALYLLQHEIIQMIMPKYVLLPGVSVNEGIAFTYAYETKLLKANHAFEEDILSASWAIAARYGSYKPHLKALEKLSMQIFDAMKKYHGLKKRDRLLLRVICILHDCGKYISIADSADCSYAIIISSEILGLTHAEREMIATVAEFNRQTVEPYDELADHFTEEEYFRMIKLLAILKVANAMDRSHKQKMKNVTMSVRKSQLIMAIEAEDSLTLEKGLFEEKADFFEHVFAIHPVIREKRTL